MFSHLVNMKAFQHSAVFHQSPRFMLPYSRQASEIAWVNCLVVAWPPRSLVFTCNINQTMYQMPRLNNDMRQNVLSFICICLCSYQLRVIFSFFAEG